MSKFFEYGEIECICHDKNTRQIAIKINVPWCVLQSVISVMLGHGFIDNLRLKLPVVSWTPKIQQSRFTEKSLNDVPNIEKKVNAIIQERIEDMLNMFVEFSTMVKNADDIVHLLPMGVYVTLQFRTTYENLFSIVEKINSFSSPGVYEFRYALSEVLSEVLVESGNFIGSNHNIKPSEF